MKCIVKDCKNHEHEGRFIGSLCAPCHTHITKGEGIYSQSYRNSQREWVGLTDEEVMQTFEGIVKYAPSEMRLKDFARAIEAQLKEKNT